jgi:hypothetical protein
MAELGFNKVIVGGGTVIVNVKAPEVPPPGAGFETVTTAEPAEAMSVVVIAACKLVLETKVVARALPFHTTVEDETKFVPVTVSVNAALPTNAEFGLKDAAVGMGLLIVNITAPELPPPGAGLTTVTIAVPAVAMSAGVIAACKLVLERKVVARALPFHSTVAEETKLDPVTVTVKAAVPATTAFGFREVTVGTGLSTVNVNPLEVPPPGAGVVTVTMAVPAVAMSAAVIAACKLVLETKVVVRELPFH